MMTGAGIALGYVYRRRRATEVDEAYAGEKDFTAKTLAVTNRDHR